MEWTRSSAVVDELKPQFCVYGIPAEVISDNGPQYSSHEFQQFAKEYGFKHTTSSPHFLRANGEAVRAIQTIKNLWRRGNDKYLALLHYRTTPLPNIELSPAQLLMGCPLRNDLPVMESLLQPANNSPQRISKYLMKTKVIKEDQKKYHDKHASKELKELQPGAKVRLEPWTYSKEWKPATLVRHHHTPRSYVVQTEDGRNYRRNRQHLRVCPALGSDSDDQTIAPAVDKEMSSPENADSLSVGPDQFTASLTVNPDPLPLPLPEKFSPPGTPAEITSSYVTRSGRLVVKPKRFGW
ncbi:Transposon Ty3-G Gag-Pol poly [Paramuricea clavata]|uniref:Transposon Ty3-G Gag-Pol poly n=1 Tax=Paramuricea clavata TaxID=317549 RepID=A0A7D9L8A5_PARCT|nr:Transposon Ty3-G Gag-Pol poly [Paramuricea clavata]